MNGSQTNAHGNSIVESITGPIEFLLMFIYISNYIINVWDLNYE